MLLDLKVGHTYHKSESDVAQAKQKHGFTVPSYTTKLPAYSYQTLVEPWAQRDPWEMPEESKTDQKLKMLVQEPRGIVCVEPATPKGLRTAGLKQLGWKQVFYFILFFF